MLKTVYYTRFRRVSVTIELPGGAATFSHPGVSPRITVGQLTRWVARACREAADYLYVLRDDVTGRLLSPDETLGQLGAAHGGHLRLRLHLDLQMA